MNIYYGGTFSDLEIGELKKRRSQFKTDIWSLYPGINIYDPLRGKAISSEIKDTDKMDMIYRNGGFLPNEIVHRDLSDILKSDIVILQMRIPSIGCSCELMFANTNNKIILIISENPEVVEHPWINSLSSKIFSKEDEVIDYLGYYLI